MNDEEFAAQSNVSRETLARLRAYAALLAQWSPRINLVSKASLADAWRRHFLDSAQLRPVIGERRTLLDFGSGAGFPAMVLAVMGVEDVHLVESDRRKCQFLREVARVTGATVTIHNARIEDLTPFPAALVTARACASLTSLLEYAEPFLTEGSECLFLKGEIAEEELTAAGKLWNMQVDRVASLSDPSGLVLRLRGLTRNVCR